MVEILRSICVDGLMPTMAAPTSTRTRYRPGAATFALEPRQLRRSNSHASRNQNKARIGVVNKQMRRLVYSQATHSRTETLPNGMECAFVSRQDLLFLYHEVYVNQAYFRNGVLLKDADTVLDIGGNIGFFAMKAAEICGPNGRVVSAEPIPDTFKALKYNAETHRTWCCESGRNTPSPIVALNTGVGDGSSDNAEFTFYSRAAGWSTMEPDPSGVLRDMQSFLDVSLGDTKAGIPDSLAVRLGRFLQFRLPWLYRIAVRIAVWILMLGRRVIRCKLQTVSQIMHEQGLSKVSLLKVDVERAELDVLRGITREDWNNIHQVVMEVHDEPPGRLAEVEELLSEAGFTSILTEQDGPLTGTSLYNLYCTKLSGGPEDLSRA